MLVSHLTAISLLVKSNLRTGTGQSAIKVMMKIDEDILNGFAIQTTNPETGEVEWWKVNDGKKFSHKNVLNVLQNLGWNYGDPLTLKDEGDLTNVYSESLDWEIAVINTEIAKSLRKYKFVHFIKEK